MDIYLIKAHSFEYRMYSSGKDTDRKVSLYVKKDSKQIGQAYTDYELAVRTVENAYSDIPDSEFEQVTIELAPKSANSKPKILATFEFKQFGWTLLKSPTEALI